MNVLLSQTGVSAAPTYFVVQQELRDRIVCHTAPGQRSTRNTLQLHRHPSAQRLRAQLIITLAERRTMRHRAIGHPQRQSQLKNS